MNIFKRALSKLKHQQQILAILVFAFIAVFVWTGVSLLSSQKATGISQELQKMAQPLTPNINREILQKLQQKASFSKTQIQNFPIYMIYKDKNKEKGEQIIEIHNVPEPSPSADPNLSVIPSDLSFSPSSSSAAEEITSSPISTNSTQTATESN